MNNSFSLMPDFSSAGFGPETTEICRVLPPATEASNEKVIQTTHAAVDGLEPYRQLIDLQKQMIELVRRHEITRQECSDLREQLLKEMTTPKARRPRRVRIGRSGWLRLKEIAASWKRHFENRSRSSDTFLPPTPLLKI